MKSSIRKFILWLIEKINLPHLLNEVRNKQHARYIEANVSNNGATFYPESIVSNGQDKSKIIINQGTHIRGMLNVFKYDGRIEIGEHCYIGDNSRIWSGENIRIGNFVLISHNVNIMDTNAHEINAKERAERSVEIFQSGAWSTKGSVITSPVIIEDYAWICFNSTILKGVTIGEGAIVAANAVVTKDVAAYTLVAGNPAKVIKNLIGS